MGVRDKHRGSLADSERALLDGLVRECGPRLLAYVRRVYGNSHDAEDIVAETFCRATANIAAIQASQRPDLYLLTVARNICRDRFRRREPEHLAPERLAYTAGPDVAPDVTSERSEEWRALQAAVSELPEHLREVVVLRLSSDLKFEEISELLQIPLGTALSRMHSALRHLRKTLKVPHEHRTA